MNTLHDLKKLTAFFPVSATTMPVLFLGHGSPMNGIEENQFTKGFQNISKTLPKPTAILCISAHWYTKGTKVTAMQIPKTIHDFGGFPQELYQQQYPAKGSPELALETQSILHPTPVELDHDWGLDHGTWTVLKHLFPKADIPVIQLSIDYSQNTRYHFELAQQLRSLRNRGVLIVGSGNIIHNLRLIDWKNFNKDNYGYDWAIEAHETINQYLLEGNYNPLINYEKQSKAFQLAIPSPDHYLPLLYALGLQQKNETVQLFNDKLLAGSLSMTSLKIS
ncbi:4,5-DOPA dioxygenase extradiol [Tenacibaculum sp. IB213877]|uniref:4,5-DOPA-extradiol-dioxygenase n=1 Tax=Tenacibaculum sp. IB213877 TaxID=3097351 RepID=UPI002A5A30E4|nr:4,5-DOPA dioxygenase extradiol [Tenacibaculum sp. IB213877]MDY0779830.1 4,5-DOPA dioxygenase extradiol [Tenacibaculum sp. IB213877]